MGVDGRRRVARAARGQRAAGRGRDPAGGGQPVATLNAGIAYAWRGVAADGELVALTESYGGNSQPGWWDRIRPHSLGWVTARDVDGTLVGFVNVAWDGGDHAFLLDTKVRRDRQRRGIGTELVRLAAEGARSAGCEWLHVDFDPEHRRFYLGACGFRPTPAGLIHLPGLATGAGRPPSI